MTVQTDVKIASVQVNENVRSIADVAPQQTVLADREIVLVINSFDYDVARLLNATMAGMNPTDSYIEVIGTDVNDEPLTERIDVSNPGGGRVTFISENYFKTFTSATVSPNYPLTSALSMGMEGTARTILPNVTKTRIKGYQTTAEEPFLGATSNMSFYDGDFLPTSLILRTYASPGSEDFPIAGEGLYLKDTLHIEYDTGNTRVINIFYA